VELRLSSSAEADLAEIRRFTLERFGMEGWRPCRRGLVAALERIAAEPGCGRPRDGFRRGLRSVPCAELMVFYLELGQGTVGIVRVLHAGGHAAALDWAEGAA